MVKVRLINADVLAGLGMLCEITLDTPGETAI
jgi:hypothetical protein